MNFTCSCVCVREYVCVCVTSRLIDAPTNAIANSNEPYHQAITGNRSRRPDKSRYALLISDFKFPKIDAMVAIPCLFPLDARARCYCDAPVCYCDRNGLARREIKERTSSVASLSPVGWRLKNTMVSKIWCIGRVYCCL